MKREPLRYLLEFAVEVASHAGRIALAHYQTGIAVQTKSDLSPVTEADRGAEQIARELIETRYPHDGILGEEFGQIRQQATRRWILDPIDGTRTFLHGVPLFGCLLAVEEEDEAVVGVMHFPALNETVYAAVAEGSWWNGQRASVSSVTSLDGALLLTTSIESIEQNQERTAAWNRLRRRAGMTRTWGDCYGHALVATGRAEAMVDPLMNIWDSAPIKPIIEEAGGVFTDWRGQITHKGDSAISTNKTLAREVRAVLNGTT